MADGVETIMSVVDNSTQAIANIAEDSSVLLSSVSNITKVASGNKEVADRLLKESDRFSTL